MNKKMTSQIRFMALFAMLILVSCAKHTKPKMVEKRLTEGVWKIGQARIGGQTITSTFTGAKFVFTSSKNIEVSGTITTKGSWYLGDDENPVRLFMAFPATATNLYQFTDDWLVTEMAKKQCVMKRNDNTEDELIFRRID